MSRKSSMSVLTARIGSRTRMKQRDIRIRFIFVVTHGHVQHFLATTKQSSMCLLHVRMQTHVDSVAKTSSELVSLLHHKATPQCLYQVRRIGRCASCICKKFINLENATMQRSSSAPITSDNISSIAMQAQVESGRICSRTLA
jgi:hypothetical protein